MAAELTATSTGKRLLLAGMNYRGYDRIIAEGIRESGWDCIQIPFAGKAPSSGYDMPLVGRALYGLSTVARRAECRRFVNGELLREISGRSYSAVLFSNPVFLLERDWLPRGCPPVFNWFMDPVWRYPQFREAIKASHASFSYDQRDCARFGLESLPLFAPSSLQGQPIGSRPIDFCFIGALYPERLPHLARIVDYCESTGRTIKLLGNLHSFTKLALPVLRRAYRKVFQRFVLAQLTTQECLELYSRTRCVINFHAAGHNGFSMRTFEALACGANVLTELSPALPPLDAFSDRIIVCAPGTALNPEQLERCLKDCSAPTGRVDTETLGLDKRLRKLLGRIEECLS